MPTYEYVCGACEHQFDEFQSMSDKPLKKCPKCGKRRLRRLFGTGAAVLFKGSGFYQTDYRSESYKAAAKAEEGTSKPADTSGKNGKSDGGSGGTSVNSTKAAGKTPKSTG
jgi:putative FmdB family regulatory protein